MYKYVISFIFSQLIFLSHAASDNPFQKLLPKVDKQANVWAVRVVNTLEDDLQLVFLNLFALNSENLIQAFIKCAEYIETQPNMLPLYEELGNHIMEIMRKYAESIQEKINLKKNISEKEKQALWQKLEVKMQELLAYINGIYYSALYKQMVQKNNLSPMYMFDEKGVIVHEKRTRSLPKTL